MQKTDTKNRIISYLRFSRRQTFFRHSVLLVKFAVEINLMKKQHRLLRFECETVTNCYCKKKTFHHF